MTANSELERTNVQGGRAVLAMNGVLGGAERVSRPAAQQVR